MSFKDAQTLIKKVLGDADQAQEEQAEALVQDVEDEQITVSALEPDQESEQVDDAVSRPSCKASTTASQRNYLSKLEKALMLERERRN